MRVSVLFTHGLLNLIANANLPPSGPWYDLAGRRTVRSQFV